MEKRKKRVWVISFLIVVTLLLVTVALSFTTKSEYTYTYTGHVRIEVVKEQMIE